MSIAVTKTNLLSVRRDKQIGSTGTGASTGVSLGGGGSGGLYYLQTVLDGGQLNNLYYTETELNTKFGLHYTKVDLDGGALDGIYDDYDHWIIKVNSEATPQEADWVYSGGSGVVNLIGGDQITIGRDGKAITIDCDVNPSDYIETASFTAGDQVLITTPASNIVGLQVSPDSIVGRVLTGALESIDMMQLRDMIDGYFYTQTVADTTFAALSHSHDTGDITDITSVGSGSIIEDAERTKLSGIETGADDYDHWIVKVNSEATPLEADFVYSGLNGIVDLIGGTGITITRAGKAITFVSDVNPSDYIETVVLNGPNEVLITSPASNIFGEAIQPDEVLGRNSTGALEGLTMTALRGADGITGMLSLGSFIYTDDEVDTLVNAKVGKSGTPADNQIAVWTGATSIEGTNNLVFTATGLGIGTTSPTYTLDVCKAVAGNYVAHIINTTAAANRPSALLVETTYTSTTGADTLFKFKSGSKEVLYGNHNGNVGIGTTTPSYGFDANCTGRFTGNFHANNSRFYAAGAVELDYNTAKKFETTSAGINIIGAAYANTDDKLFDEGDEAWQTSTATNPTWNMATSRNFEWTMASSGTLTISNGANGNSGVLILRANGAYTATLPASSTPASLVVTADNNVLAVYTKLNNGNYIWSSHTFLDPV